MPEKKYYVYIPGTTQPTVLSQGDYDAKKDKLHEAYPEANVVEMQDYKAGEEIGDSDFFINIPGTTEPTQISAKDFAAKQDKIYAAYPDVQVSRIRQVDYYGDKLGEIYDREKELKAELEGLPVDTNTAELRNMADEDLVAEAGRVTKEKVGLARRAEINKELDQLYRMREENPAWKRYWAGVNAGIDEDAARIEKMQGDLRKENREAARNYETANRLAMTGPQGMGLAAVKALESDPEYNSSMESLAAARLMLNDAKKAATAPSRYGGDDKGAWSDFWRGIKDGAPEALSEAQLVRTGLNMHLVDAIKKIQNAEGREVSILDLVKDDKFDDISYLNAGEKELVKAFVKKAEVEGGRGDTVSRSYQSGQSAVQSLGFMADFMMMGGAGEKAAEAVTGGLVKSAGRNELAKIGAETLYGTVKALAMTPLMPSTYNNLMNNILQFNDAGGVDLSGQAVARAIGDVVIENISETVGSVPMELAGIPLSRVKFPDWAKAMRNSAVASALRQAGYHGFIEEMVEEWTGNALRVMTGVDKNALKDFATIDQQLITAGAFAPMSFLGLPLTVAQYTAASRSLKKAGTSLEKVLDTIGEDRLSADEKKALLNTDSFKTPEELAHHLADVYHQIVENGGDAATAYKAVMDYVQADSQYKVMTGVFEEQKDIERGRRLTELNTQMGNENWHHAAKNGVSYVRIITDADGGERFVTAEDENGFALVDRQGNKSFLSAEDLAVGVADGTLTDNGEQELFDYLDKQTDIKKKADDQQRVELEQLQNETELMRRAQPGTEVNLGTVENPIQGTIVQFSGGKFIVQGADGNIREFDRQEMANILDLPLTPLTQEQQEAADAEEIERRNNLRDRARTMIGRNIAPILGREGDIELVMVHTPVETSTGPRYQVDYKENGQTVLDFFTEEKLNALIGMSEQTPAVDVAEQTESEPKDDTPRDFRGNPLPMRTNKKTGQQTVDQNALWNKDPEAWARWNDSNPNQRVTSKERLEYTLTELNKEIEKDTKAVQKAALKGIDEDEMDNMEAALGTKLDRRELLQSILNKYNLPAEAGQTVAGEQRRAAAEQVRQEQQAGFPGIQQRWNETPKIVGAPDEIRLPNGETVTGNYVLTEALAPTASHNPANGFAMTDGFPVDENGKTVNDRDYERDKAAQQSVLDKAAKYDQRALQTPVIVSADGVVLSGNDRTMASQIAASQNTDGAYLEYLSKYPQKYGFTKEQVGQFQHPRVVFVPDTALPYNAATFAKFNAEEKKSQSKTEKAVKAGKTLNAESLGALATLVDQYDDINALYNSKDGVNELLNILLSAEVISQEQVAALRDGDTLSGAGMDLLESTLIGAALDEEAVRVAMSDKSIRKSVVSAISQILIGNTLNDYTLRTELTDAITLVANGKALGEIKFGESVQDYIRQQHLFMDDVVAEASVQLLADAINDRKTSFLKKVLSLYNRDAVESANGQMSLLTGDVLTREAILRNILEYLGYDTRIIYDTSERAAERREQAEPAGQAAQPVAAAEAEQAPAPVQGGAGSQVDRAQYDREEVAIILEQGNVGEYNLTDYMTDEEVAEFVRRWEAFLPFNDAVGEAYSRLGADLRSSDKKKKKAAQAEIDRLEMAQEEAHAPVQEYVDELIEKYGQLAQEEAQDEEEPDEIEEVEDEGYVDEDEESKPKKGKKGAKKGKKEQKPARPIVSGKHSEEELATVEYTQDEWEQLVYGGSMFCDYTSKKTGEKIEIVYADDSNPVYNDHQIRFWSWQKGAEYGERREGVVTTDYMLRYLKLNGFKQEKPSAKKNKYGYWVNTHGVIVNPIRILLPSTHKGWANMNYVSFAQNDKGKWTTGASFHTATGGYSGPVSGGNNREGFDTKVEAIKYLLDAAEKYLKQNFTGGGKSKTYEQRDLENLINALKTKTLPQAMLEEGVVDTVMRVDLDDAGEAVQGDLFGSDVVAETVPGPSVVNEKPKKESKGKKKTSKRKTEAGVNLFGEEVVETPDETDEESEPRFTIEDEEGTPGNFHWVSERICTNPQILIMPGADRLSSVPKVSLAEKDGKWYQNVYVTADGGKGSSWGSMIPSFKSSYIPFDSREDAIKHALEYMRYLLDDRAKKSSAYGETFNETKGLIDYIVKMELPKEKEKKQETVEDALGNIKNALDNFAQNGNYARVVRTVEAYQDFFGEDVAEEIDTILSDLRKNGISKESKDEMVRRVAGLYNRLVNPQVENEVDEGDDETVAPVQAKTPAAPAYGSQNTIITTEKYEELKKRMLEKLGQLNAGFDPEVFFIGAQMAAYHVEAGARKFVDFAQRMINDLGDAVRPYLKAIYNGARDLPGMEGFKPEMDSAADVDGINVDSIGIEQPVTEETPAQAEETKPVEAEAPKNAKVQQVDVNALFGAVNDMYRGKRSEVKLSEFASDIKDARENTDTNPSDAQKEAGNYKKGHISIDGYDISLENPKGSVRSGKDANGNEWSVTMNNDYGYIRMTEGVDGDHIDVFLSDNPTQGNVFVVDQVNEDGSFDEHKVMYGFESADEASKAYLANYSPGWKGLGAITEVTKDEFKKWVDSSHRKMKPFAEYKSVNPVEGESLDEKASDTTGQTIGELGKYTHTKTGKEMSIVRLTGDRVSADEFKQLKARAKEFGGYYSSYGGAKGFLFENEADAIKFNTINAPENAEEQTDVETAADTAALVSEAASVAIEAESLAENEAPSEQRAAEVVTKIDNALESIDDQLALLGYYEADTTDQKSFNESYGYMKSAEKKAVKDADKLAKRLADDLGINVGRKKLAVANIAPAGGDITFRLPLNGGMELYVDIELSPVNGDDLQIRGMAYPNARMLDIMYRVENPSASGQVRYVTANNFAPYNVSYADLLKGIRNDAKDYLPETPATAVQEGHVDILQIAQEQAEKYRKSAKKTVSSQEEGDAALGGLFAALYDAEEPAPVEEPSQQAPAARVKPTEVNGFTIGEKVQYRPSQGDRSPQTATIYDFEYDGRPVLDTGLAPVLYEVVDWEQVSKIEQEPVNETDNGSSSEQPQGVPAGAGSQGEEAGQESAGSDRGGEGGRERDLHGRSRTLRPRYDDSVKRNTRNNRVAKGEVVYPKTPSARFKANIAAIRLLKELQDSGKDATKEQMAVLRQYTGWGGLGGYFNNEYTAEHRELKSLLTDEEMAAAALSINTAYYTPVEVIDNMWEVAKRLGFEGGNILEGSAGTGAILASMPKAISERSAITAVELDNITGGILRLLYPDATVHVQGFQETDIDNGSIDLAITNVPFGDINVYDSKEKDITRKFGGKIHDFCIAKNIRKLAPGGLGIFISTRGTLDNSSKTLRQWIVNEGDADVIGAFRLNNETFEGTGATSDIIVVRKRVNGNVSPNAIDVTDTQITRREDYELSKTEWNSKTRSYERIKGKAAMEINSYFVEHPENMGGEMGFGFEHKDEYRPGSSALWPSEKIDQNKRLAKWAKQFSSMQAEEQAVRTETEPTVVEDSNATKEGQLVTNSKGEICISRSGKAIPLGVNAQKVKGYSKAQVLSDYNALKTAINEVLDYQLKNESDEGLKPLLSKLNRAYDTFAHRYSRLNRNTAISFLRNDVDFPAIAAVEDYKEKKSIDGKVKIEVKKTSIFSGRVLGAKRVPTPKDAKDGVIVSMNQFGRIDVPFIADALNKDEETVRQEILDSGLGFENPLTGGIEVEYEYLSGNVREKLEYAREHNTEGKYDKNVSALEKVVPADIPAHLIEFSLGSDWMPVELYTEYAKEKFDVNDNFKPAMIGGSWAISDNEWEMNVRTEKNRAAGVTSNVLNITKRGHELMIAAMNNSSIVFSRTYKDPLTGQSVTETDKEATQAATQKMSEMRDDFKEWARAKMLDDPELAQRVAKVYNDTFNAIVPKEIKSTFLPEHFEGMATKLNNGKELHLREHQAKAVIRGTTEPLMLAHEVGTGKTFTLIATAMEMRRLGTAKKPMIVVQNATLGQFVSSAKELYPNAKVLTISEADRTVEGRTAFYAKIKYNDWDMIIVPQSVFEMIPDSEERQRAFIQEKIEEKEFILEQAKQANNSSAERQLKKELEDLQYEYQYGEKPPKKGKKDAKKEAEAKANAVAKAKKQLDRRTDDVSDFDDMGIDALLVDEAHSYKHLGFSTAMQRGVKGVDSTGSKKSAGVYLKTRAVFDKAGWKNVVFATGTPISNTAAEIWTFMKYLMPDDVMRQNHIYYFDDFVRNFGNIAQSLEFTTSGKFKENTRFASYTNLPELIRIWWSVCDTVRSEDAVAEGGAKLEDKQPKMENWTGADGREHVNQARDIYLPQSGSLVDIMNAVRAKLEWYEGLSGKEKKENSHIPLTMFGIAKMAAIDPRLVDREAPDEPLSKTNRAVEETLKALKDSERYHGTCALFCDNFRRWDTDAAGRRAEGFNIFEEIKRKLVEAGVPEDQIVIMKSGMNTALKEKIFARVNAGEVRVIMGTTATLGTGVNIQERLFFEAHLDAPNRPMDYTQRNGRILRQGNLHRDWGIPVRVVRFGVEDSLDVTAYQRLSTKSKFIDSVMNGKPLLANGMDNRVLEEAEEGEFDNPVAVLSGSQYALLKSQAERELRKLRNKKEQYRQDQIYIDRTLKENNLRIEYDKQLIDEASKHLATVKSAFPDGKVKEILIEGKKVNGLGEVGEIVKEKITGPLRELVERRRNDRGFTNEDKVYKMKFDGYAVDVEVSIERTMQWNEKTFENKPVMSTRVSYSCKPLGIVSRWFFGGMNGIKDIPQEFINEFASGRYFEQGIMNLENTIARLNADNDLMLQRRGKPFAEEEKLQKQEEIVKDYTEKMKAEMAEKEKKYADMAKSASGSFNLDDVEVDEDEDGEGETHNSEVYNNAPKLNMNDPTVVAEAVSAVNRVARRLGLRVVFDNQLGSKGAYTEGTDYVRINLANCESVDDAVETLLHEGVAHFGLREMLGEQGMREFIDDILTKAAPSIRRKIQRLADENAWSMEYAAEEYVAELAQKTDYTKAERSLWRRIMEAVRNLISSITGRETHITDDTIREMLVASYARLEERAADTFDNSLQRQIDGTLPEGYVHKLGLPGEILRSVGVPNLPIELAASRLAQKAENHGYELSELKGLVEAINDPVAVFQRGKQDNIGRDIIVEIEHNGKNLVVGMYLNPVVGGQRLEINSIRTVYPKDTDEWVRWIKYGRAWYLDKERIKAIIAEQRMTFADVSSDDLNDIANIIDSFENPNTSGDFVDGVTHYRKVTDKALLAELENGQTETGYRNVAMNADGSFGSPMAGKLGKKGEKSVATSPFALDEWEQAEENPDMATEDGKINLIKSQGRGRVDGVDYNPYIHIRPTKINRQFTQAWMRPELVFVETEYPTSELESGYHAEKAKLSVGRHAWNGGELILSRYDKPVRVVPFSEVADDWVAEFADTGVTFDIVLPGLLPILAERGVEILPPKKAAGKEALRAYNEWRDNNPSGPGRSRNRIGYHGSIANFDAFDINHSGEGEGYASHGFGHYVALNRGISVGYAWSNAFDYADRNGMISGELNDILRNDEFEDENDMVARYDELLRDRQVAAAAELEQAKRENADDKKLISGLQKEYDRWMKFQPLEEVFRGLRNIYTVEIPEDTGDNYIDEMKTLSKSGRRRIAEVVRNLPESRLDRRFHGPNWLPQGFQTLANVIEREQYAALEIRQRLVDALGSEKAASQVMHDAGFVGITYEGRVDGPCVVIFSSDDLRIVGHDRFRTAGVEGFISNAEAAVNSIQMEKATPQQWLKMIEGKGGLKAGEDKWIGLSDWLKASDRKTLTKQEVLEYINQNKIQIEEQNYAEDVDAEEVAKEAIRENVGNGKSLEELQEEIDELVASDEYREFGDAEEQDAWLRDKMIERYGDDFDSGYYINSENKIDYAVMPWDVDEDEIMRDYAGTRRINSTRLNYTTNGLTNKREVALTVPTIEPWKQGDNIHFGDAGEGRAIAWVRFGETNAMNTDKELTEDERYVAGKRLRQALRTKSEGEYAVEHFTGRRQEDGRKQLEVANKVLSELYEKYGIKPEDEYNRVLVIDEIQSKRHQEARDRGYSRKQTADEVIEEAKTESKYRSLVQPMIDKYGIGVVNPDNFRGWREVTEEDRAVLEEAELLRQRVQELQAIETKGVPEAPFEKNWHELAMKRMLRLAAEEGYGYVAWTTGGQQAERYDIGQYINSIGKESESHYVLSRPGFDHEIDVDENGIVTNADGDLHSAVGHPLSELVGKSLAEKMIAMEVDGEDLNTIDARIGGEGMKGFYDDILPRFMNKYGKKWGVKVEDIYLPNVEADARIMHAVRITPEMRESVMQGQMMFREGEKTSQSPVSYNKSTGAKRLAASETARKFGVEIEFRPSSEMRFNGKPLAGRWINGKMYICPEHCRDNDDAVRTVLHEGVGHNGLRRLIGDKNMREFCLDLFRSLPKAVRNKIASDAVSKYGGNVVESVERFAANDVIREVGREAMFESTEEWLAETSETIDYDNYRRNVWDIIRDALRRVLAKVGINVPLSIRDVKWLMVQSAMANHETDPMVEARRQVVANALGFTLRQQAEKAEAVQLARNRIAEQELAPAARIYNKDVLYWFNRLHETWVDKDNAVHQLVNAIEKATGKAAKAFEDIRLALNQQSSKGLAAIEKFERECWAPMQEAIRSLMDEKGIDLQAVERYVMIKHGLERNEVFAKRDAREFYQDAHDTAVEAINNSEKIDDETKKALIAKEDAKLTRHIDEINAGTDKKYLEFREQDYGGLTAMYSEYDTIEPFMEGVESEEEYQARVLQSRHPKYTYIDEAGREQVDMAATEEAAQQEVNEFENGYDAAVKELWKRINAATKSTLKHQYDANMMSRDQYQAVSGMFKYYVPLRGFAENTAEDMYDYYQSDQRNDFTPPLLKAKGRKTEAESPFGYIGSMASSGIAADMKNETKLALYYFVSNRANNDLVTISEVWYKNTGVDELGRRIFTPVYPPFKEDLSGDEAKQAYEEWEKQMQEEAKAGFAFKGGKKLNLRGSVIHIDESQKSSHVIKFKVGGRDMMMYINGNPRAAQAINNELNVEMSADYQKVFGKVLRWFSGINTSYNPEFWLSNAQRDILFALMSVNVKEDPEYNEAFRKNLGQLVKATLTPGKKGGAYSLKKKLDNGQLGDERLDRLYKEFVENGGVTGYTTLKNNEEWELELRKFTGDQKKAMQAVKTVFEKVQHFGEAIEQMTRFSAYITSREQGKEIKDAVNDAKELTVNFNRKGSGKAISFKEAGRLRTKDGKKLTALQKAFVVGASWIPVYGRRFIMFFNASTQGLNAMYKLYKKDGKRMGLWTAGFFALGVIQAAIHAMLDDDDDYLDIPDYERRNNLLLGGNGVYFKWAIPQEARVFYAIGDMVVNHALGREPNKASVGGWAGEIASVLSDIAPLNPSGGLAALAPSALTPIVEVAMNRDYKGAKIFNDLRYLSDEERKRTPAYQRAFQGTGKVYVLLSQFANWMTGGDYADAGWINPVNNPAAWEHIIQGATGGAGTTIGKFYRGTFGQILGEDFTVRNTPFLSRLVTVTDDRYRNAHTTELFDYYKAEAEHTKKMINTYRKNGDDKKLDRIFESEDYEIMTIYDSYKSQLQYYNDELKATTDKKDRKALMREQDAVRKEMILEISNIGKND